MRFAPSCFALAVLCSSFVTGCATAVESGLDGVTVQPSKDGGRDGARGDASGVDTGGSGSDSDLPPDDSGNPGDDSSSTGDSSSPDDASSDSSTTTDTSVPSDGGPTCIVPDPSACAAATSLGSISGDTGSGSKTATGSSGQWLQITVTENDSSLFSSKDLRAFFTLTSPPGENFDLFVYEGKTKADGGGIECTTVSGSSTSTTSPETVSLTWTDHRPIGGADDTRILSIEVRAVTPTCDPSASWSLLIEGNK